jgi:hypothetical protein
VYARICAKDDRTTSTAVSSIGTSERNELLTAEMACAGATLARLYLYDRFIDKLQRPCEQPAAKKKGVRQRAPELLSSSSPYLSRASDLRSDRLNRYELTEALLELNYAINECEEGEVTARAYVCTSMVRAATLTNEDVSCTNNLTTELLNSETLSTAISSVLGTSYRFLMCHDVT